MKFNTFNLSFMFDINRRFFKQLHTNLDISVKLVTLEVKLITL